MNSYYTIAIIAILGAISPGPDFVIVAKNALAHNRQRAMMASLGIGAGILIHASYCVLGLALIISQSLLLFNFIKYLGAIYLIYLGIKGLLSGKSAKMELKIHQSDVSLWMAFREGLLTNLLNPKCTLFMLSMFTVVIKPTTSSMIQSSYGIEIAVITTLWFILLSYGLTLASIQRKMASIHFLVSKLMGAVLLALGIIVMLESR